MAQNGEIPKYKSWANFLCQNHYRFAQSYRNSASNPESKWQGGIIKLADSASGYT